MPKQRGQIRNGFWAQGLGRLLAMIDREEDERLGPLTDELRQTKDKARRKTLKREIREIRKEQAEKRKSAQGSLFLKH